MSDYMTPEWGSDAIADLLSRLGFEFAVINPGASYRGLHDSLVNRGGPQPIVALHEEHAVAIAHGWTKVTERPALAIIHSNVGLMHASMAVYNAWVDRAPVVLLGATGAVDASRRRPWIEWIHTMQDQAALVRPFVKWDDQPASVMAALESIAHARALAMTAPRGPVYVCLDVSYQEERLPPGFNITPWTKLSEPTVPPPAPGALDALADRLSAARRPMFLFGRMGRSASAWNNRVALAERFDAAVACDIRTAATFPCPHPQLVEAPGFGLGRAAVEAMMQADVVVAFDWIDLAGTLQAAPAHGERFVASVSLDAYAHRGFVKDGYAWPALDLNILATPDDVVSALLERAETTSAKAARITSRKTISTAESAQSLVADGPFARIAAGLEAARRDGPLALTRLPLSWPGSLLSLTHPLDYLGRDGGEGLASGPGLAVGAALALKGTNRLPVAIVGDGDFMMGASALWTAANLGLPLLIIVANNRVYGNDVVHQERVAKERGRPVANKWIAQRLEPPAIDIAAIARAQGFAPALRVEAPVAIAEAVAKAAKAARDGACALVEVVMPATD